MENCAARVFVVVAAVFKNPINGAAGVAGDLLTFASYFGQLNKCFQHYFGGGPLLSTDIPKTLPPVIGRRRIGVLSAQGQGPCNRVAQVALVSVVAIDTKTASAQLADHFVFVKTRILKNDVFLRHARGVDHQGDLCTGCTVFADLEQGFIGNLMETLSS